MQKTIINEDTVEQKRGTPDDSILLPDPVEPQGGYGGSKHQYHQGPFTFKIPYAVFLLPVKKS